MTDRYENIRKALVNGLTPGPWGEKAIAAALRAAHKHDGSWIDELGDGENMPDEDDASLIAACDPDTIRELMAERDALLDALRQIAEWPDGGNRYGQEKIKKFARNVLDTTLTKEDHND